MKAAEKLSNNLSAFYGERPLDILCAGTDEIALGCLDILASFGYSDENRPMIISQGGGLAGAGAVLQGDISMTVYKDIEELAQNTARIAHDLVAGQTPVYNDAAQFHNHIVAVPAWI